MNLRRGIINACFATAAGVFGVGCAGSQGLSSSKDRVGVEDACQTPAADHGDQTPQASKTSGQPLKVNIFKKKTNHPSNYSR